MAAQACALMAITDVERFGVEETLDMATRVCLSAAPGRVVVLLRDRQLPVRERLRFGRALRQTTRGAGQSLAVAERADLALLLEADALHLPENSAEPSRVRELLRRRGGSPWLSRAVHSATSLPSHCDAWVFSPVVEARKGRPAQGFDALARLVELAPAGTRVFALGGVGAAAAARCLECGAAVAAISAAYAESERLVAALGIRRD